MKILCHAGPWSDSYFKFIVDTMYPQAQCTILSGHKKVDRSGLCENYYAELKSKDNNKYKSSEEDLEVIARCRLLRALDLQTALLHLNCMRSAIVNVLENCKPDLVLTETIDSYIMDLLDIESKRRSIPCVGLVTVFVNGYYRVSVRGEYVKSRKVAPEETLSILSSLDKDDYLPSFVTTSKKNLTYNVLKNWFRNIVKIPYFQIKRFLSDELYNYHYWQSWIISRQWFSWIPVVDPGHNDWADRLSKSTSKIVYLPLQMFPEATIDYWCESLDVIDYEKVLVDFIKKHSDITFLIKEHPNVGGYRSSVLYKELKACANVVFCPTTVQSNSLKSYYDAILIWTGSAGFEAAIRGKPVLCASRPYYFNLDFPCFVFSKDTKTWEIESFISEYAQQQVEFNKLDLVKYVLEGCLPGRVRFDGSWSIENKDHVSEAKLLASSLKGFIEKEYFADPS